MMKYDLLIKGGRVFSPQNLGTVDIAIKGDKISALGNFSNGEAEEVINAKDMLIFPGIIETHAHMLLPLAGTVTKNDFYSGTVAGAFGGVTTLIDFADQKKGSFPLEAIKERINQADGRTVIDYSFHCTLTDINKKTVAQIKKIIDMGITSFKIYTIYKEDGLYVEDGDILKIFEELSKLGALVTFHAENESIVRRKTEELKSEGKISSIFFPLSKPAISEEEAVRRVILLAKETGVTVLFRHISSAGAINAIREAKLSGQQVYGETCPHYLMFTNKVYQEKESRSFIVHPPIRDIRDREELWKGIYDGSISVIGTDDCAFTKEQKKISDNFFEIPGGIPGIETRLVILFDEGVLRRGLSVEKFVEITSSNPAKIYGLYPKKGTIQVGSDADLIIINDKKEFTIKSDKLHDMADWSPFEGRKVKVKLEVTISKGKVIVKNDKFLGKMGDGRFLKRRFGIAL